MKRKENSQPYYRDKNVRNSIYRQGEEIKKLRGELETNKGELEKLIQSVAERIDGGANLARAQEVYAALVKASQENPLVREQITSAEVSLSLNKLTLYLLSNPEFRERLGDLYNLQLKLTETEQAKLELEERRHKQMRRTTRVVGTTIVATTLAMGAMYVGKGYYDIKFQGQTTETLRKEDTKNRKELEKRIEETELKTTEERKEDKQKIAILENTLGMKTEKLTEDISTLIQRAEKSELQTEKGLKQLGENYSKLEQERAETSRSLAETLKSQAERIAEQDKKVKNYELQLEEQKKTNFDLTERLNKLEKSTNPLFPTLN